MGWRSEDRGARAESYRQVRNGARANVPAPIVRRLINPLSHVTRPVSQPVAAGRAPLASIRSLGFLPSHQPSKAIHTKHKTVLQYREDRTGRE